MCDGALRNVMCKEWHDDDIILWKPNRALCLNVELKQDSNITQLPLLVLALFLVDVSWEA